MPDSDVPSGGGDTPQPEARHRAGRGARVRRRVTTDPPPGSDPAPLPEPPRHSSTENDARLRDEKPPHY